MIDVLMRDDDLIEPLERDTCTAHYFMDLL